MSRASARVPIERAAPLFAALGDETRLSLLADLSRGGPRSIVQLGAASAVTRQAVAKHLAVLADAGLVRSERRGRERIYALDPRRLDDAHGFLDRISREWDVALERLRAHLEDD